MRVTALRSLFFLFVLALLSDGLTAQVSCAIEGRVTDETGEALPGVRVEVQRIATGEGRETETGMDGFWRVRGLPPGEYSVTCTLDGFQTQDKDGIVLLLGQVLTVDMQMNMASFDEMLVVTAETPIVEISNTGSATYVTEAMLENLSLSHGAFESNALLGLVSGGPLRGTLLPTIDGSLSGQVKVDGLSIDLRLIPEAALGEVQVLNAGVSAEFGGTGEELVNVVTRYGTNTQTGQLELEVSNPDWEAETAFEEERGLRHTDEPDLTINGSLGGPLFKDALHYFVSGRRGDQREQGTFAHSGLGRLRRTRGSALFWKLDAQWGARQTVGITAGNPRYDDSDPLLPLVATPAASDRLRRRGHRFTVRHDWILGAYIFFSTDYAYRSSELRRGHDASGFDESPVLNTSTGPLLSYNRPFFDSADPQELRQYRLANSVSWLLGEHDLKLGLALTAGAQRGGFRTSSTGFLLDASPLQGSNGRVVVDDGDRLIPLWTPGASTALAHPIAAGAEIETRQLALFAQDSWRPSLGLALDLGLRFEAIDRETNAPLAILKSSARLLPRLGLAWEPGRDGRSVLRASWGLYAARSDGDGFFGQSSLGQPPQLSYLYQGPAGVGFDFAPAFDLSNYQLFDARVPGQNLTVRPGTEAPLVQVAALGYEHSWGNRLKLGINWVYRGYHDLIEDTLERPGETVAVDLDGEQLGVFDRVTIGSSSLVERRYQAMELAGSFRARQGAAGGSWTYQIENDGNVESGNLNRPSFFSTLGEYPAVFPAQRSAPEGPLADGAEQRGVLWGWYRWWRLTAGLVLTYESGRPFSLVADDVPLTEQQLALLGDFRSRPRPQQVLFFGGRGSGRYESFALADLLLRLELPQIGRFTPSAAVEILNLFGEDALQRFDTELGADEDGPVDGLGLALDFVRAPTFGEATGAESYVRPRSFRLTLRLAL